MCARFILYGRIIFVTTATPLELRMSGNLNFVSRRSLA